MKQSLQSARSRPSTREAAVPSDARELKPGWQPDVRAWKASDVHRMQRTLGNHAVNQLLAAASHGVIQRKPADIDKTWSISFDATGKMTNVGGVRAVLKRATVVNAQMRDGWVKPNEQLTGGHLFKREYGGPDDETNVVPWKQQTEDNFTVFEDDYELAANTAAQAAAKSALPFTATVKTKAQFVDRPDLKVTDDELDTAGWPAVDAERKKRQDQYADVAEHFSGIPIKAEVDVTGLSSAKHFEASKADIGPDYVRNDDAIKPAYVVPRRFLRNAKLSRDFVKVPDWKPQKSTERGKLGHVASRHGDQFGVAKSNQLNNLKLLETKLELLVNTGEQILGVYRKIDVVHYVDHATKLWLCTEPGGALTAAFMLTQDQYDSLTTTGHVTG